jgi:hypothetical protein
MLVLAVVISVAYAAEVTKGDLAVAESKGKKQHVVLVYDDDYGSSYGSSGSSYGGGGSSYGSSYDSYDDGYEVKVKAKGKGKGKGKSKGLRTTYGYDGPSYSPISYGGSSYGGSSYGGGNLIFRLS